MGKLNTMNKQVDLRVFAALCLATSLGILALQSRQGIAVLGHSPDVESGRYTAVAKVHGGQGTSPYTQLSIQGARVELGEGASVTFATDAKGVGRIPLALAQLGAKDGRTAPVSFMHALRSDRLAWTGSEVQLSGLRPSATYKIEAALWLWGQPRSDKDPTKGDGAFRVFDSRQPAAPDCADRCVVGFGLPSLVSLQAGPVLERAEVAVLSRTLAFSPMLLALMGMFWRPNLRPAARKGLVALGLDTVLPMPAGATKVG